MNRKRILLFGATGQTGKELLKQALNEGHTVTAVARDPDKLEEFKKYVKLFCSCCTALLRPASHGNVYCLYSI